MAAKLYKILHRIIEKSVIFLLILALIWQFCFPRVTSLAATIEEEINEIATPEAEDSTTEATALTREEQMVEIISEVARQEGYENVNLVIAIARAESRLNPNINGEQDKRDRGLFQINRHFNPDVDDQCAYDPWCSTRWTIKELRAGHAWKWNASRYKWGRYYTYNR